MKYIFNTILKITKYTHTHTPHKVKVNLHRTAIRKRKNHKNAHMRIDICIKKCNIIFIKIKIKHANMYVFILTNYFITCV